MLREFLLDRRTKMKEKLAFTLIALAVAVPAGAQPPVNVPEPSTLALFASAAIAIVLAGRFKK